MIMKSYRWFGWTLFVSALVISLAGCEDSRSPAKPDKINASRENNNGWGFTK